MQIKSWETCPTARLLQIIKLLPKSPTVSFVKTLCKIHTVNKALIISLSTLSQLDTPTAIFCPSCNSSFLPTQTVRPQPTQIHSNPHTIHLSGTLLPLVHLQRCEQNIITDPTAMSLSTTLSRQQDVFGGLGLFGGLKLI